MKQWTSVVLALCLGVGAGTTWFGTATQGQQPITPVPVAPKEMTSYRDVVKKVLPAVVSIEAKAKTPAPVRPKDNPNPRKEGKIRPNTPDEIPEELRKFFEEFGGRGL